MKTPCRSCIYGDTCTQGDAGRCDDAPAGQYPHFRDKSMGPEWVPPSESPMSNRCRFKTGTAMEWEYGHIIHRSRDGRLWILENDVIVSSSELVKVEVTK
jgi:hypothetical protein